MTADAQPPEVAAPTLEAIRELGAALEDRIVRTPVHRWRGPEIEAAAPAVDPWLKLELLQVTGTFKPRGALSVMLGLDEAALARGVTAVSAGNHAIAVAYAAGLTGSTAKVVMPRAANGFRVERCRAYGAEVVLTENIAEAFGEVERIQREEGRHFVHPFEGPRTVLGTATVGLEMVEQIPGLEAVVVPIGGGGLAAGIASAVKQARPDCAVYGVEPEGAASMRRSIERGEPVSIERVETIADSLGAPYALPQTFALCRRYLDEVVAIDDDEIRAAMAFLFQNAKLAVEPAGAAATAALLGPLRSRLAGRRVGLVVCGSNIDIDTYHRCVLEGAPSRSPSRRALS